MMHPQMGIEFMPDGGVNVTVPSTEQLWAMLSWYHVFIATGAYGLVTHIKTLPAIHRVNRELAANGKQLSTMKLFAILLLRSTVVLPARLACFVAGLAWVLVTLVSTGVPRFRNDAMRAAWHWHFPAEALASNWESSASVIRSE